MRILVCFKTVYDLEYITPQELVSLQDGSLDISVFRKIIGSYDEAALETALRLAENARQQGETVTIHALTAGDCEKRFIDNLFPLGFDEVIRIPLNTDYSWQPELIAGSITAFVKNQGGYDAIITGKQAGPGESGLVPHILACGLGYACIPEVFSLERNEKGIRVSSKTDAGQMSMTVVKPAVYTVGEALYSWLRIPTLREKIAAGSREPLVWQAADTGPVSGSVHFLQYTYTMLQRECWMIQGKNLEEKLKTLQVYLQKPGNV